MFSLKVAAILRGEKKVKDLEQEGLDIIANHLEKSEKKKAKKKAESK